MPAATYSIYKDLFTSQDNAGAYYAPAVVWSQGRQPYQGKINAGMN
jgi:hypothetical protein